MTEEDNSICGLSFETFAWVSALNVPRFAYLRQMANPRVAFRNLNGIPYWA